MTFSHVLGGSYTYLGGTPALEQIQFVATAPAYIYLELPGIAGASSTPGHPDVMLLQSFTLNANDFSITKAVDSASPQLDTAISGATLFPTGNLLIYDSTPTGAPDAIVSFQRILGSGFSYSTGGNDRQIEQDDFDFATLSPEPRIGLVFAGLLIVALRRQREGRDVRV